MRCSLIIVMRAGLTDTQTRRGRTQTSADVVAEGVVSARVTSAHPATISPATSAYLGKMWRGWIPEMERL